MTKEQIGVWEHLRKLDDVNTMFDMMISAVYFAGKFGNNIPVDEARKTFDKIKQLTK